MSDINWNDIKMQTLEDASAAQEGELKVDSVKMERSFLLKTLIIFFGIMTTCILMVVLYQLLVKGDVDKSIEVMKFLFSTISPLLGTLIGYYFGRQSK